MAVNRITLARTEQSENVLIALRLLREARDRLEYGTDVMEACIDTSTTPADYSALETVFGAPAGTGQIVYNLVVGTEAKIDANGITAAIARLG